MGATANTKVRTIAVIPVDKYQAIVDEWKIAGNIPSPVLQASAGWVGTAARIVCGVTKTAAAREAELDKEPQVEIEKHKAQAAMAVAAAPKPHAKAIKLSTVLDQANDGEVPAIEQTEIEREEDLTPEQLADLLAWLSTLH